MKRKLLAVAVGAALAAPVVAQAQSSVTISGKVHASFGQYKVSGRAATATGSSTETQVRDESSRIIFAVREDLGGGLAAIGRFELRPSVDVGAVTNRGTSFVGLTSSDWGTLTFGRHTLHSGKHASFTGDHAGNQTDPNGVFNIAAAYGATGAAVSSVVIGGQTRSNDVVRYLSPKFANLFQVEVGYSASATTAAAGVEADLRSVNRKGSAWNLAPTLFGANWEAGYSYWTAKPDTAGAAPAITLKHRGDSLYGWYKWGGLRVGLAWDKSKVDSTSVAGVTTQTSNVATWGIPVSYTWGPHIIYGDFYWKDRDKATAAAALDTKARFYGVTYAYALSKRTSAALSYTKIRNNANAGYNLDSGNSGLLIGEDPSSWHVTLLHRY